MEFIETYWTPSFTIGVFLIGAVFVLGRIAKLYGIGMPSNKPVEIDHCGLKIDGTRYGGPVQLKDLLIEQSLCVDLNREKELQPYIRTMGVGSGGYKSGWFKLRNGQRALVFLTDLRNVVYIPTRFDYVLLLSVGEPAAFLGALRNSLTA